MFALFFVIFAPTLMVRIFLKMSKEKERTAKLKATTEKEKLAQNAQLKCNLKNVDFVFSSLKNDGTQIIAVKPIPKNTVIYKGTSILSYTRHEKESSEGLLAALNLLDGKTIDEITKKLIDLWPSPCMQEKIEETYHVSSEIAESCLTQPEHLIVMWTIFNHFQSDQSETRRRFLFQTASKFNHSCQPNCCWELDSKTETIVIRTLSHIQSDQQCTLSYIVGIENEENVQYRQKILKQLRFKCQCERCKIELK